MRLSIPLFIMLACMMSCATTPNSPLVKHKEVQFDASIDKIFHILQPALMQLRFRIVNRNPEAHIVEAMRQYGKRELKRYITIKLESISSNTTKATYTLSRRQYDKKGNYVELEIPPSGLKELDDLTIAIKSQL